LFASKTENERYVPLSKGIARVVHARIREGLSDDEFLFPGARVSTFDNAVARACRKAAELAKLNYGQKNGFTCHSFRHTFITDLLIQSKDIPGNYGTVRSQDPLRAFPATFTCWIRGMQTQPRFSIKRSS
jgi:integrase